MKFQNFPGTLDAESITLVNDEAAYDRDVT
jgi:hypothetical protein